MSNKNKCHGITKKLMEDNQRVDYPTFSSTWFKHPHEA